MAIDRFGVLTDGFDKPEKVAGNNLSNGTYRGLLITDGYFYHVLSATVEILGGIFMGMRTTQDMD